MNWSVPTRRQIAEEMAKQGVETLSLWAKQHKVEHEMEVNSVDMLVDSAPGDTLLEKSIFVAGVLGRVAALTMVEDDFGDTIERGLVPPQMALIPEYKGQVRELLTTLSTKADCVDAVEQAWHSACDTALQPFVEMAGGTMEPSYCPKTITDSSNLDLWRNLEEYQWLQSHKLTPDNAKELFLDVRESVPNSFTLLDSLNYMIKGLAIQAMISDNNDEWESHAKTLTPVIKLVVRKTRSLEGKKLSAITLLLDCERLWSATQARCEKLQS